MSLQHSPRIITDGLVLCLDAANKQSYPGSGTVWTDLAGSNNGTLTNGPTFNSANGGSIVFDGSNDHILGTLPLIPFNSSVTIEAVIRLNNTSLTKNIITQGQSAVSFSCGMVVVGTELKFRNSSNDHSLSSPQVLLANQWYHLVLSTTASGTTGYINAVSSGTTVQKVTSNSVVDYAIGKRPGATSEFMNGNIAKISIYSKALTQTEIQQNYNATKSRYNL
jgi:Concanavalin A-like lectin/glucanases superfamily